VIARYRVERKVVHESVRLVNALLNILANVLRHIGVGGCG